MTKPHKATVPKSTIPHIGSSVTPLTSLQILPAFYRCNHAHIIRPLISSWIPSQEPCYPSPILRWIPLYFLNLTPQVASQARIHMLKMQRLISQSKQQIYALQKSHEKVGQATTRWNSSASKKPPPKWKVVVQGWRSEEYNWTQKGWDY